jgi:anti-sigma factor ChrR (cupin superfamily)
MPGVERMMLDRIGDEVAQATTIVRFEPNSSFSSHEHGGGEEFLVLDGVFSDEHRDYPVGTYVRNPVGTAHTPRIGVEGATILVKLHQFERDDQDQMHIDTLACTFSPGPVDGIEQCPLHCYGAENVIVEKWASNARGPTHVHEGGEELFVMTGRLSDELGSYPKGTWLRNPPGSSHACFTESEGATVWIKTGHLTRALPSEET